jgi:hypothetical protein
VILPLPLQLEQAVWPYIFDSISWSWNKGIKKGKKSKVLVKELWVSLYFFHALSYAYN